MDPDRLVVVSDLHVDFIERDLPDAAQAKREKVLEFFDWLIERSGAQRLVINGDLVDIPQKDGGPLLPRYQDIAGKLRHVLAAGIKLGYVIGNHDAGLLGLDIALEEPPLRIHYPYIVVGSARTSILVEHGHLQDPWLWDYVCAHAASMLAHDASLPPTPFWYEPQAALGPLAAPSGGPPGAAVAALTDRDGLARPEAPAVPRMPPAEALPVQLLALWQTGGAEVDPESPGAADLLDAGHGDLEDGYADVTDPAADETLLNRRAELREQLALSGVEGLATLGPLPTGAYALSSDRGRNVAEFLPPLVQALYSGPHWRRAAKHRLAELAPQCSVPITGVIMGHTHYPDEHQWMHAQQQCHYVNSGSWRGESADIVVVANGQMRLFRRDWRDDWPELP